MRIITSAFILAIAAGSCVPPGLVQLQADDLEPALTQETMGRAGADRDPEPARGGAQLFYASTSHDSAYALYVKTVGGNAATKILSSAGDLRFPRINPVRNRTLAYCTNESGSWQVVVVADYLAAPEKKVVVSEPGADSLHPSWSPDGKQLVYCCSRGGDWTLRIRDVDQGRTTVLENLDGLLPDWSPVGNRIVFQRMKRRDDWISSIWTVEVEQGAALNVTSVFSNDDFAAINPTWSPDGRKVAFATVGKSRARAGVMNEADDIWVVGLDGVNPTRITSSPASDGMPRWSDAGRLYFVSDRSGSPRLWSIQAP